jgi:hypothetical protein
MDWQEILEATNPNNDYNIEFFEEQFESMFSNIFAADEWLEMLNYICT